MDESMRVLQAQEQTYTDLVGKINMGSVRLNSVRAQNKILEDQHERDRLDVQNKQRKINELRNGLDERERVIEELKGQVSGEFNRKLESMRVEENTCEDELRMRDAAIDTLESGTRVLTQKVEACQKTCTRRGHPCTLLRGQIAEQDAMVILLKDELRTQAGAMTALNTMVDYKQIALENLVCKNGFYRILLLILSDLPTGGAVEGTTGSAESAASRTCQEGQADTNTVPDNCSTQAGKPTPNSVTFKFVT